MADRYLLESGAPDGYQLEDGSGVLLLEVPPCYKTAILASSPVAYWRLGEPSGVTAVDEIGALNLDYIATPTLGAASLLSGDADTAVTFNGTDEDAEDTSESVLPTGNAARSIEAWVKTTSSKSNNDVFGYGTQSGYGDFCLRVGTTGSLTYADHGTQSNAFGGTLNDGNPHQVVLTWNGTTMYAYIDGSQVGSGWAAHALATVSGAAAIGVWFDYFAGTIDEVSIYSRALPSSEVADHFAAAAVSCSGPAAELAGVAAAASTATGALTTSIKLAGVATATSSATGALTTGIPLAGVSAAISTAVAQTLTGVAAALAGAAGSVSTATATLATGIPLAGVAAATSSATSALTTGIPLAGLAAANSTATAQTLTGVSAALAGVVGAASTGTAALTTGIPVAGAVGAGSTATGSLTTAIQLAGASVAGSTATAVLTTGIPLAGAVAAASTADAALTAQGSGAALAGAVSAAGSAAAALTTGIPLAGASTSSSATVAVLTTGIPLAGAATASSSGAATLTTGIALAGSSTAQSTADATLTAPTAAALSGTVAAVASVTGSLVVLLPNGRHGGYYRYLDDEKDKVVAKSLHAALIGRYGAAEGQKVYERMQAEQKGPFAPTGKYARGGSANQLRDFIRNNANRSR